MSALHRSHARRRARTPHAATGRTAARSASWVFSCLPLLLHAAEPSSEAAASAAQQQTITVIGDVAKSGVPLAKTPQSVTVLDREQLDTQAVRSVEEALRYAPGVQTEQAARNGYEEFSIRGFSQSQYQFKDGLRLDPGYLQQQEPFGLERIEVLKGPASVLYGQIAPGGLVNSVSKLPTRERLRQIELTLGSFGLRSAALDLAGTLDAGGRWRGRVVALASDRDDRIDFVFAKRQYLAPSLTWAPTATTTVTLLGVLQHDDYRRADGLPPQGSIAPNPNGVVRASTFLGEPSLPSLKTRQSQIGWLAEHRFNDQWTARQKLRYMRYEVNGAISSPFFATAADGSQDLRTLDRFAFDYRGKRTAIFAVDNQLEGQWRSDGLTQRLLIGLDHLRNRQDSSGVVLDIGQIDLFNPVYGQTAVTRGDVFFDSDNRLRESGLYAQYRATLGEQWVGVIGQRASRANTDNLDRLAGTRTEQSDNKRTGNYALMWLGPQGLTPYVSYAESFRPQVGFDPLLGGGQPPPAQGRQVELGLKWSSPQQRFEGAASVFDIRETNVVVANPLDTPGTTPTSILVDGQRVRGAELEGVARLTPSLDLRVGYAHLRASQRAADGAALVPTNIPRHAATLLLLAREGLLRLPGAEFSLGLRYVGERAADSSAAEFRLPAYTVADLGARWRWGHCTLGLDAKNLFDKRYFSGTSFGTVSASEPRTLSASLRIEL